MIDSCQSKVSADQYHVTNSRAQVKSSPKSRVFLKLTAERSMGFLSDRGLRSGYYSRGERGKTCKDKISAKLELWRVVDFSSDIFLGQSYLGKSLI